MAFTHDRAVDLAVAEIRGLAELCDGADLSTPVPTCPGWTLADLLRHTSEVNRWAATMVREYSQERLRREQFDFHAPADPAGLPAWVAERADVVEEAFRPADPTVAMWAWGWPKLAGFWPRRMIHETGVHRADAELALGRQPAFDPEIAVDGVEELLDNLPQAAYFAPGVAELKGDGEILLFVTDDATWAIPLQPDGFSWVRDDEVAGDATLAVRAPGDLLLTLYRRRPPAPGEVTGRADLVDRWLTNSSL